VALGLLALGSGCSVRRYAVNSVGDMLASGGSLYERDDDIELVGDALPFSLKLVENLLEESPKHRGLLLTACRGFTVYSYAFVHYEAERQMTEDVYRARALRERARRLYLRAHDYGLRGLEVFYPGFGASLREAPEATAARLESKRKNELLPLVYWSAASLGLAVSASKNDASMLARIPEVEALLDRALELDEGWDRGSLHEFTINLAGTKTGEIDEAKLKGHFERALALSRGERASVYVTYAETVSVPRQDASGFRELLGKALAVDLDARPDWRFANRLSQRRADWLLGRIDEIFLEPGAISNRQEETR
jgi:predicted anti-sigma-YlaC factor YlaD